MTDRLAERRWRRVLRKIGETMESGGYNLIAPKRVVSADFTSKVYKDWVTAEYEIERLRKGLQQIVDGDYPADAINGETWAAEVLADSHAVEWDGAPISRSPLAAQQPLRPEPT